MRTQRKTGVPTLVAAVVLSLAACSSGSGGSAAPIASEGTNENIPVLKWALAEGPRSLDPAHAYDGSSAAVYTELLEPLVGLDADGRIQPRLARAWSQPDPTTLVFDLRTDVKFWDGKSLTAEDAVFSLRRHIDPQVASELMGAFAHLADVTATSPSQVTVKLSTPDPSMAYSISKAGVMEKDYALAHASNLGDATGLIMGTGPYTVKSFSPATGATLARYEGYYGSKPTVAQVEFTVIPDPDTRRLAMQSGEVDGTFSVPLQTARQWDTTSSIRVQYSPSSTTAMVMLDNSQAPFTDPHVRRALSYALDRDGIVKSLAGGHGRRAASIIDPTLWTNLAPPEEVDAFYRTLPPYDFDMAKAKAELAQSASPNGFTAEAEFPNSTPGLGNVLQSLAANVKPLGITINVSEVPAAQWLANIFGKKGPAVKIASLSADYPTPMGLADVLLAPLDEPTSQNVANYAPADVLQQIATFRKGDKAAQVSSMKTITGRLSEDVPYIPVYYSDVTIALARKYAYTGKFGQWTFFAQEWVGNVKVAA
ncbi:ABC transporter substrate-binding protein [Actinocrispum wychmicini]|uniref:Peptide/nickel transport system substrate-binding protein n=1 Tax=Actinocrispum wychmicini TaxID=1213861 RepID=A0A4R2J7P3_9PSEU|nr:ABC transporter substrate-binding protein [Actinocrispum wychmicini]TCO54177.1 peptide/nickel transport system substrate-binding protein [Actinocrispum wychmicini]